MLKYFASIGGKRKTCEQSSYPKARNKDFAWVTPARRLQKKSNT